MLTNYSNYSNLERDRNYFEMLKQRTLESQRLTEEQIARNEQLRIKEQQNQIDFNVQQVKLLDVLV